MAGVGVGCIYTVAVKTKLHFAVALVFWSFLHSRVSEAISSGSLLYLDLAKSPLYLVVLMMKILLMMMNNILWRWNKLC